MDVIQIEATPKTPMVHFDPDKGHIEIRGRSIPENSLEFYKELLDWLEEYGNDPRESTNVEVQLEYFNTSSSKCILDVFKALEGIHKKGKTERKITKIFKCYIRVFPNHLCLKKNNPAFLIILINNPYLFILKQIFLCSLSSPTQHVLTEVSK